MLGEVTTTAAEAGPPRLTWNDEPPPARTALRASQVARTPRTAEDARLREAVRALLAAIDALP
jgi:hypothetical protein